MLSNGKIPRLSFGVAKQFENLHPHRTHTVRGVFRWKLGLGPREPDEVSEEASFSRLPHPVAPDLSAIQHPNPKAIQVTWIGHASFLIQLGGYNFLTDPVFSDYCAPLRIPRLRRLFPPGVSLKQLPSLDGVLISHCHYDHLDRATIRRLDASVPYYVPTGLSQWFHRQGIGPVHELGWWEAQRLGDGLKLHCCPAQHFSSRRGWDWNRTLWCGWILECAHQKVYFTGDTGYCPVFQEIGRHHPDLDLSIIPIGAYRPRWLMQPIHVNPAEAVQIHRELRSRCSIASHWGTFRLTDEPPGEPAVLLGHALLEQGLSPEAFRLLRIGETLTL